jgi:hypothetical protein
LLWGALRSTVESVGPCDGLQRGQHSEPQDESR